MRERSLLKFARFPQKVVAMSNGRTGIMNIMMSADEYDEECNFQSMPSVQYRIVKP